MEQCQSSPQSFYIPRKTFTRSHHSTNYRHQISQQEARPSTKVQVRNTSSLYIQDKDKTENRTKQIKTAFVRQAAKSAHRYKKNNFSMHKQKSLNNSVNPMLDFRRKNERDTMMSRVRANQNLTVFLNKVTELQDQFSKYCLQEQYEMAADILIKFLNYTVDLNLIYQFTKALMIIADFYLQCGKTHQSLFYFNEAKQSSLLLNQPKMLIQSLIGVAKCCSKVNLQKQGISILKKALQYAWYHQKKQLELQLYDEIGQKYYHLGDIQKAKKYHQRYINSIYQPVSSAHKSLSKQRIKKAEQLNIQLKYSELSILFLVHLKIPIRSLQQIPPLIAEPQEKKQFIRNQFNINKKYFSYFQDFDVWINSIMKNWFFSQEMDEPLLPNEDWTAPLKLKKFAYIDFKLNQHLKKFNSNVQVFSYKPHKDMQYKQNLDEKVTRKLKEPPIDPNWYQKMVKQITRDHKNKLLNVRNAVRVRGYNKPFRPSIQILKQIYNQFFDKKGQ